MRDSALPDEDAIFRAAALSNAGRPNDAFLVLVDEVKRLRATIAKVDSALRLAVETPAGFCTTTSADCDHESCEALAAIRSAIGA